jgi:Fe-Mn family superoxide dismutase
MGTARFSDQLLQTHLTLYQGYVNNTNKLAERLNRLGQENQTGTPEYAELNRRFGWEFNGMRLHEYYFGNLIKGGAKLDSDSTLFHQIRNDFGSLENWRKDFTATAALRGIGWTILYFEPIGGRLFNSWVTEHDIGHLAGAVPILVLDVFEHAYMGDYGLRRADYIDAFMNAVDWNVALSRFLAASGRQSREVLVGKSAYAVVKPMDEEIVAEVLTTKSR